MCDSYVYAKPILSLSTTISYVNIFILDIQTCYQIVLVICINLVHQSKKSFFSCCIFASLQLILICFKLSCYPLFCLQSRFLSKFDFCEITLLLLLFLPKIKVSNKVLQNGQNYTTTAFTFLPLTYFFCTSTTIYGRFHRFLGNFLIQIL